MKIKILAGIFAFLLTAFTLYAVLDTFVITKVYQVEISDEDIFRQRAAALEDDQVPQENEDDEMQENAVQEDAAQQDETDEEGAAEENDRSERRDNIRSGSSSGDSNRSEKTTDLSDDDNDDSWRNRSSDTDPSDENDDDSWRNRSSDNGDSDNWGNRSDNNNWNDQASDNDNGNSGGWGNRTSGDNDNGNWWDSVSSGDASSAISDSDQDFWEYTDDNIQITIRKYEMDESSIYAADIRLSSAEYLKSAFAGNQYGRNVTDTTSSIAADNNAILAINGDYYGAREIGYVIRNGVVYRDKAEDTPVLCIYADGSMKIADPSEVTAEELVEQGVWQAYSFGPVLVEDGKIAVTSTRSQRSGWGWGSLTSSNPRTAIGILGPLHYLFVVSDGRTDSSEGLTLTELAEFMQSQGVTTAYNLDGGGSSTMVFQGEVINRPTTTGAMINERSVSDIVYIG